MVNFRKPHVKSRQLLTFGALALIFISIVWRFFYRGDWVPGWDLVGQSQGQFFLETGGLSALFKQSFWDSRHYQYWTPISSTIYTLIPGQLGRIWPWLHWGGVLNLIAFALFPILIIKITKLTTDEVPFLLLAFASSPALVSFSIANYPYITGCLPHLISLAIIFSQWFRARPWLICLVTLLLGEFSLHLYPLGQTFFVNFLLFALLDKSANLTTRIAWVASTLIGYGFTLWAPAQISIKLALSLSNLNHLWPVFQMTFIESRFDHSLLFWLGLISCGFVKRERLPITLMFLAQWWLILVLVTSGNLSYVRSRRLLVAEIYGVVLLAFAVRDQFNHLWAVGRLTRWGKTLLGVLLVGAGFQFYDLIKFTKVPIMDRNRPLPHVESAVDYYILPTFSKVKDPIIDRVRKGKILILFYDYSSPGENTTDPRGLLEMLYLQLGHKIFSEQVLIFSGYTSRYSRVPVIEPKSLLERLKSLERDGSWKNVEVWYPLRGIKEDTRKRHAEMFETIGKLFKLNPENAPVDDWDVYVFAPLTDAGEHS